VFVSRFITPPLPGESTARVEPNAGGIARGAELLAFNGSTMQFVRTVVLPHSDRADAENQGRGIPNYLGALAISPDGSQAYVPAKQDNVMRGQLRDRRQLDFQNTVRAISARIDMASTAEDTGARIDHDNASLASAAAFDPSGVFLFVTLETSRELAVLDAHQRRQLLRVQTGFAPQAVAVSPEGDELYIANFMSRSLSVHDIGPLRRYGLSGVPRLAALPAVAREPLSAAVFKGKQLFYDARDTRLARERYMSCASCHADGGHDGRTWDFTGFGEGLRNTPTLQGKAGMAHGRLHWSGNFDEVQDFENQIRGFAGGTGLIANGTPHPPMGEPNAGRSTDLDALAAYVGSLSSLTVKPGVSPAPLSPAAQAGRQLFAAQCAQCHGGSSAGAHSGTQLFDVGTLSAGSGQRLGGRLGGIDVPPLQGLTQTAPYLHDGSAPTLEAAIRRHNPRLDNTQLQQLAAYLTQADPAGDPQAMRPATELSQAPATLLAGAAQADGPGQIRLVPASTGQAGAVWATQRWSTTQAFQTRFQVQMERAPGQERQADGLAFVLQSGEGGVGGVGGGQGWLGLPGALAAQLLTWNYNRAGLTWEGREAPSAGIALGRAQRITGEVTLTWDPGLQRLAMDGDLVVDGQPHRVRDIATIDLAARYGPTVLAGITAATGGSVSTQRISGWTARFGHDAAGAGGRVVGDALAQPSGAVQLTPDHVAAVGGWASARRWPTNQGFDTRFHLDIRKPQGGLMADGLGLVLHGGAPESLGGPGGCQGSCDLPGAVRAMLLSWSYNQGGLTSDTAPLKPLAFNLGPPAVSRARCRCAGSLPFGA
jgi:cytochrome c553